MEVFFGIDCIDYVFISAGLHRLDVSDGLGFHPSGKVLGEDDE